MPRRAGNSTAYHDDIDIIHAHTRGSWAVTLSCRQTELVAHASRVGLTVALTPSGTAAATPVRLLALRDAGLKRIAVSLDGPDPDTHDAFRGVRGSYQWTMRIIES